MFDCIIEGGDIIDGTGSPRHRADAALQDGRIVEIGRSLGPARRRIDARGCVVSPGFIDVHTHYDAQVFWDPFLSPTPLHGVTTVVAGHCGFSIAPSGPQHHDYLMKLLGRVEEIPLEALREGVDWSSWRSFGEFLDRLDGTPAINMGFMVGHCAIRRVVMGDSAVGSKANESQIEEMQAVLCESLEAGAFGLSSSAGKLDFDHNGDPTPSRWASDGEIYALASMVRDYPWTTIEWLPEELTAATEPDRIRRIAEAAGRPVIWNLLQVAEHCNDNLNDNLRLSDEIAQAGGKLVATFIPMPLNLHFTLAVASILEAMPNWRAIRFALPRREREEAMRDPDIRRKLKEGAARETITPEVSDFADYTVQIVALDRNKPLQGRKVGEIAAERGIDPLDCFLDIALDDDLRTVFIPRQGGSNPEFWDIRKKLWDHPGTIVGGTDGGAHLMLIDTFSLYSDFVGRSVRERKLLDLERAVHLVTQAPADFLRLKDRGLLKEGCCADIVVFDPQTFAPEQSTLRSDLPGGATRLYAGAVGMHHVFVGGEEIACQNEFTGACPGTVLRGGLDTH